MKKALSYVGLIVLYFLHQDFWFWNNGTLVFGVLPVGLLYHLGFCVAASLLLLSLIRNAWPDHLQVREEGEDSKE
ncbi:MAG: DUF3311 domain-containing protein [Acidobacteriota bacterium]